VRYPKLTVLLVLFAAVAGTLAWLAGTTGGLRFIAARALPHVPASFDPDQVEGRLVGPMSFGRIEFAAGGLSGSVERVSLDWQLGAFLRNTLHVLELRLDRPRLAFDPEAAQDEPPDREEPFSLPLNVIIDRLVVQDGELRAGDEVLFEALDLELGGRAADRRVALDRLELHSSRGQVRGHASASLDSDEPWDVDLAWEVTLEERVVAGRTRAVGRRAHLEVVQDLSAPVEARIEGTLLGLPDALAWRAELALEPLPPGPGLWPQDLDGFSARLHIEGNLGDSTIRGHFELPAHLPGRVDIEARGGWEESVVTVRELALGLEDGARLVAAGRLEPGEAPAAEFELSATGLGWPLGVAERDLELPRLDLRASGADNRWRLSGAARVNREGLPEIDVETMASWEGTVLTLERLELASIDGEIRATAHGTLDTADAGLDYRMEARGNINLEGIPPASASLTAEGDRHGLRIESLAAELLGGTVSGGGRIAWEGDDAADFSLVFAGLDPAGLNPDWPGRLSGELDLRGLPETADGLELTLRSLRGELRSLPVTGSAALNARPEAYLLRRATFAIGGASIEATGRLDTENVSLEASLDIPALEALDDSARGNLRAKARVDGARDEPRIELEADGQHLRWQANRVRELRVDAMVDLSGTRPSRLSAELDGFATAPGPGGRLLLEGDGLPEDHRIRLQLDRPLPDRQFVLAAAGSVELGARSWSGQVTEISIAEEQQALWTLQAPAGLSADTGSVTVRAACMDGTFGKLCVDAGWAREGPWSGRMTLSQLDLDPLTQWLAAGLRASGVLTGQMSVQADDEAFRSLTGGLELTAGEIRLAEEDTNPLVAWHDGALELSGDVSAAYATLRLDLVDADGVEGRLAVGWNDPDPPLDGLLEVELRELQLITELLPDVAELEGRATLQASVSGTLGAPELRARFEWRDGTAHIPTAGLQPSAINVVAELDGGILMFTATGRSGEGTFEGEGRFDLGADAVEGRATLVGENLLVAELPEARVTASPDLRLSFSDRRINIGGEVRIPTARITGAGGPAAVSTSPDEVIVGRRARADEEGIAINSRVRVTVGPDVQIQAAGLRGRVEGALLTVIQPQELPWGRGELRVVDGTFGAFGQRLEIETGRLIFTGGPLENPGLEIRAVRKVDNVTAGALVRGTLQFPEISIYSDPPMPRAEALAYLTLGKSLDELQAGEQTTLDQAASSLAMSGGGLIARDLGRRLGFDDVAVTADDADGGTSLVVSKHLGGGIYVSYGLGLFDTMNTLRLRYQINQRLSMEAKSGEESAADLVYTFERD
jgi:translocation and assembly module TamB